MDVTAFPHDVRTCRDLRQGDVIAVPLKNGRWGCLHVVELRSGGPGSRTSFIAGVLPWIGDRQPVGTDVEGMASLENALTRIEIFTEGGCQVSGNVPVVPTGFASNFRDYSVGTVTHVWGWKAAMEMPEKFEPSFPRTKRRSTGSISRLFRRSSDT